MIVKYCIFLLVILASCVSDQFDNKLKIINNLNCDLYIIDYDTTSLNDYPNHVLNLDYDLIRKNSIGDKAVFNRTWESCIKNAKNKKLNLFIIDAHTINAYSRDHIIQNKMYLKVISYSLEEVRKLNWIL
jgi:hypothetical protein